MKGIVNEKLADYIKASLKKGESEEQVREKLSHAGHDLIEVGEAMTAALGKKSVGKTNTDMEKEGFFYRIIYFVMHYPFVMVLAAVFATTFVLYRGQAREVVVTMLFILFAKVMAYAIAAYAISLMFTPEKETSFNSLVLMSTAILIVISLVSWLPVFGLIISFFVIFLWMRDLKKTFALFLAIIFVDLIFLFGVLPVIAEKLLLH